MRYDLKESGKRIQSLRKQQGLTQVQLAEHMDISSDNLSRLERGLQGASIDLLIELADFFAVSIDYIAMGREMKTDMVKAMIRSAVKILTELEQKL